MIDEDLLCFCKCSVAGFVIIIDSFCFSNLVAPLPEDRLCLFTLGLIPEIVIVVCGERLGPGLRIRVVSTPVALQECIITASADGGEESGLRSCFNDNIDEIGSEDAFHLLLDDLALFIPVRGGRIVLHENLDRECAALCGQFFLCGVAVLLCCLFVKTVSGGDVLESVVFGVILACCGCKVCRCYRVVYKAFRIIRLINGEGLDSVKGRHHCLAEVLVVDGDLPVFRLILLIELRIEVEAVEIAEGVVRSGAMDLILGCVITQPGIEKIGADLCRIDLAVLVHRRFHARCIGIVGAHNLVDVDIVLIPVGRVLGEHVLFLRLIGREDVSTVVPHALVVEGERISVLIKASLADRHIGGIGNNAQKERAGLRQSVNQGVIIRCRYSDIIGGSLRNSFDFVAVIVGGLRAIVAGNHVGCVIVIFLRALDDGSGAVHVLVVAFMRSVIDVFGGCHPVVCRDVGFFSASVVDPLDTLADAEGPLSHVIVALPAFCQTRCDIAVAVVVNKAVDDVGADCIIVGGAGCEVIQCLDFAGVEGVVSDFFTI